MTELQRDDFLRPPSNGQRLSRGNRSGRVGRSRERRSSDRQPQTARAPSSPPPLSDDSTSFSFLVSLPSDRFNDNREHMILFKECQLELQMNLQNPNAYKNLCKLYHRVGDPETVSRVLAFSKKHLGVDHPAVKQLEKAILKTPRLTIPAPPPQQRRPSPNGGRRPDPLEGRRQGFVESPKRNMEELKPRPEGDKIKAVLNYLRTHTIVLVDKGWAGEVAFEYTEVDATLLLASVKAPGSILDYLSFLEGRKGLQTMADLVYATKQVEHAFMVFTYLNSDAGQRLFRTNVLMNRNEAERIVELGKAKFSTLGHIRYLNGLGNRFEDVEDLAAAIDRSHENSAPKRKDALAFLLYSKDCKLINVRPSPQLVDRLFDDSAAGLFTVKWIKELAAQKVEYTKIEELIKNIWRLHSIFLAHRKEIIMFLLGHHNRIFSATYKLTSEGVDTLFLETGGMTLETLQEVIEHNSKFTSLDNLVEAVKLSHKHRDFVREKLLKMFADPQQRILGGTVPSVIEIDALMDHVKAGHLILNIVHRFSQQGMSFARFEVLGQAVADEYEKYDDDVKEILRLVTDSRKGFFQEYGSVDINALTVGDVRNLQRELGGSTANFLRHIVEVYKERQRLEGVIAQKANKPGEDSQQGDDPTENRGTRGPRFPSLDKLLGAMVELCRKCQKDVRLFLSSNQKIFLPENVVSGDLVRNLVIDSRAGPHTLETLEHLKLSGDKFYNASQLLDAVSALFLQERVQVWEYLTDRSKNGCFAKGLIVKEQSNRLFEEYGSDLLPCLKMLSREGKEIENVTTLFEKVKKACQDLGFQKEAVLTHLTSACAEPVYLDDVNTIWKATHMSPSTKYYVLTALDESEKANNGVAGFQEVLGDSRNNHVKRHKERFKIMKYLQSASCPVAVEATKENQGAMSINAVGRLIEGAGTGRATLTYLRGTAAKIAKSGKSLVTLDDLIDGISDMHNQDKLAAIQFFDQDGNNLLPNDVIVSEANINEMFQKVDIGPRLVPLLQQMAIAKMKCKSFSFLVKAAKVTWEQGERDKQEILTFFVNPLNSGLLLSKPDWTVDGEEIVDTLFNKAQTGYATLSHLQTLKARGRRFKNVNAMIDEVRLLALGDTIFNFITGFSCSIFGDRHPEISRDDVGGMLASVPCGDSCLQYIRQVNDAGVQISSLLELETILRAAFQQDRQQVIDHFSSEDNFARVSQKKKMLLPMKILPLSVANAELLLRKSEAGAGILDHIETLESQDEECENVLELAMMIAEMQSHITGDTHKNAKAALNINQIAKLLVIARKKDALYQQREDDVKKLQALKLDEAKIQKQIKQMAEGIPPTPPANARRDPALQALLDHKEPRDKGEFAYKDKNTDPYALPDGVDPFPSKPPTFGAALQNLEEQKRLEEQAQEKLNLIPEHERSMEIKRRQASKMKDNLTEAVSQHQQEELEKEDNERRNRANERQRTKRLSDDELLSPEERAKKHKRANKIIKAYLLGPWCKLFHEPPMEVPKDELESILKSTDWDAECAKRQCVLLEEFEKKFDSVPQLGVEIARIMHQKKNVLRVIQENNLFKDPELADELTIEDVDQMYQKGKQGGWTANIITAISNEPRGKGYRSFNDLIKDVALFDYDETTGARRRILMHFKTLCWVLVWLCSKGAKKNALYGENEWMKPKIASHFVAQTLKKLPKLSQSLLSLSVEGKLGVVEDVRYVIKKRDGKNLKDVGVESPVCVATKDPEWPTMFLPLSKFIEGAHPDFKSNRDEFAFVVMNEKNREVGKAFLKTPVLFRRTNALETVKLDKKKAGELMFHIVKPFIDLTKAMYFIPPNIATPFENKFSDCVLGLDISLTLEFGGANLAPYVQICAKELGVKGEPEWETTHVTEVISVNPKNAVFLPISEKITTLQNGQVHLHNELLFEVIDTKGTLDDTGDDETLGDLEISIADLIRLSKDGTHKFKMKDQKGDYSGTINIKASYYSSTKCIDKEAKRLCAEHTSSGTFDTERWDCGMREAFVVWLHRRWLDREVFVDQVPKLGSRQKKGTVYASGTSKNTEADNDKGGKKKSKEIKGGKAKGGKAEKAEKAEQAANDAKAKKEKGKGKKATEKEKTKSKVALEKMEEAFGTDKKDEDAENEGDEGDEGDWEGDEGDEGDEADGYEGKVKITVSCKNLAKKAGRTSHPFVEMYQGDDPSTLKKVHKTETKKKNLNPNYDMFVAKTKTGDFLRFSCWCEKKKPPHTPIGVVDFHSLQKIIKDESATVKLNDPLDPGGKPAGEITIKIQTV